MSHPRPSSRRFHVDPLIVIAILIAGLAALWMLIHADYRAHVEHDKTKVDIEPATRGYPTPTPGYCAGPSNRPSWMADELIPEAPGSGAGTAEPRRDLDLRRLPANAGGATTSGSGPRDPARGACPPHAHGATKLMNRLFFSRFMVEAPGIEPGSENTLPLHLRV